MVSVKHAQNASNVAKTGLCSFVIAQAPMQSFEYDANM